MVVKKVKKSKTEMVKAKASPVKANSKKRTKGKDNSSLKVILKNYPAILTTKEVTQILMEEYGIKLGQDLTAGSKNLRRLLRSIDRWNDDEVTAYRWSQKNADDMKELSEIIDHYQSNTNVG